MTHQTGPALSESQIREIAPGLPAGMARTLARQRSNESRVRAVAENYAERLRRIEAAQPKITGNTFAGDPIAAWQTLRDKFLDRGMSEAAATRAAVRENPALHQEFVKAFNKRARHA